MSEKYDFNAGSTSFCFNSIVEFKRENTGAESKNLTGFEIQAYTGAAVECRWGKLVVAVDGISCKQQMPIFKDHDHKKIVGYSTSTSNKGTFSVKGVFSKATEAADEVKKLAIEGFPWQASIGVRPKKKQELKNNDSMVVNGRQVTGPAEIWLESEVFETSFVPLGADNTTSVAVFSDKAEDYSLMRQWESDAALRAEFLGDFDLFRSYVTPNGKVKMKTTVTMNSNNRTIAEKVNFPKF
jgi:hypothetical protein